MLEQPEYCTMNLNMVALAISTLNVFSELKLRTFLDSSYSHMTNPSFAKIQRCENHSELVVCVQMCSTIDDGEAVDDDDEEDEEEQS